MPVLSLPAAPVAVPIDSGRRPIITPGQGFAVAADAPVGTTVGTVLATGGLVIDWRIIGLSHLVINPRTGRLTVDRAPFGLGSQILRVRAANNAGATEVDLDLFVADAGTQPSYTANSLLLFANSSAPVNAGS